MNYLLIMIEQYKQELTVLVRKYGISSLEAVACSQELDELLNLLLIINQKKRSTHMDISLGTPHD